MKRKDYGRRSPLRPRPIKVHNRIDVDPIKMARALEQIKRDLGGGADYKPPHGG